MIIGFPSILIGS